MLGCVHIEGTLGMYEVFGRLVRVWLHGMGYCVAGTEVTLGTGASGLEGDRRSL